MIIVNRKKCSNCGSDNSDGDCNGGDHYFGYDKLMNLTPHSITIAGIGVIPSDGILRCDTIKKKIDVVAGIPVIKTTFTDVIGFDLPPQDNRGFIHYIVSLPVAQALKGKRTDIYIPYDIIMDELNVVIGCNGLGKI